MANLIGTALVLILAQNIVFSAFGSSEILRISSSKKIVPFCGLMAVYCLVTALLSFLSASLVGNNIIRLGLFVLSAIIAYLASVVLLKVIGGSAAKKLVKIAPLAAFNSAVMVIPFAMNYPSATIITAIGIALSAAAGFTIVAIVVGHGIKNLEQAYMPKAFRGLPSAILYMGILAMAVSAFNGRVFFV